MTGAPLLCPRCQAEVHEKWPYCAHCGSRLGDTNPPVPTIPVCENCGSAVETSGAFCWKCGVPLATGRQPFVPAPVVNDIGLPETPPELPAYAGPSARGTHAPVPAMRAPGRDPVREVYGHEPRRGTPGWVRAALVALAVAVVVLAFLWVTPYGAQVLGRPTVYVSGVNETGIVTFQGTPQSFGVVGVPPGAPLGLRPGQSFSLSWVIENPYSNRSLTYTVLAIGSGWSGSVSPSAPLTLAPFQSATITVDSDAPSAAGSYFVPVTADVTVT